MTTQKAASSSHIRQLAQPHSHFQSVIAALCSVCTAAECRFYLSGIAESKDRHTWQFVFRAVPGWGVQLPLKPSLDLAFTIYLCPATEQLPPQTQKGELLYGFYMIQA